jgi:hypothetical protein
MLRDQWLGEIWSPLAAQRHYIPAIQSAPLTGMRVYGWKWINDGRSSARTPGTRRRSRRTRSRPARRKRPPTGSPAAGTWTGSSCDLGSTRVPGSDVPGGRRGLRQQNRGARRRDPAGRRPDLAPPDIWRRPRRVGVALSPYGLTPSFVGARIRRLGRLRRVDDRESGSVVAGVDVVGVLLTGTGSIGGQAVFCDPTLPAGTVLAGARQAATYYQAPGGSPLRVTGREHPQRRRRYRRVPVRRGDHQRRRGHRQVVVVDPALPLAADRRRRDQ